MMVEIIPLPNKIIVKIVHSRLSSHLENNKLLDENQGGFRKKTLYNRYYS